MQALQLNIGSTTIDLEQIASTSVYTMLRQASRGSRSAINNGKALLSGGSTMVRQLQNERYGALTQPVLSHLSDTTPQQQTALDGITDYMTARGINRNCTNYDDLLQVARLAILEYIHDTPDIADQTEDETTSALYKAAYKAINAYVYAEDSNTSVTIRYTTTKTGDISHAREVHKIKYPHAYMEQWRDSGVYDIVDETARIDQMVTTLSRHRVLGLTARQSEVLRYIVKGYSQQQTADAMRIHKSVVARHIQAIRRLVEDMRYTIDDLLDLL